MQMNFDLFDIDIKKHEENYILEEKKRIVIKTQNSVQIFIKKKVFFFFKFVIMKNI